MLLGLALMLAELLTPGGFFLIFFGAGAIAVGLVLFFFLDLGPWMQLMLFAALSIAALSLFRRRLLVMRGHAGGAVDSLVGETAFALDDIPAEGFGKAELRGSAWNAHNVGSAPIAKSQRCRVERVEGLTLWIKG